MTTEEILLVEDRGPVRVLTLNRPRQRNSLLYETWERLEEELARLRSLPDVRVVVVTGSSGFFSAGGDLKTGPAHGHGALSPAARVELAQRVLGAVRSAPVPVIAAVEGAAVGLGWSLVLASDLVVAASDAWFSAPFVQRAVVPDGALAWQLTQQLGRQRAADLLFGGGRLEVAEAHRCGLVSRVTEPEAALDAALAWAAEVSEGDAAALEMTKRLLGAAEAAGLAAFQPLELAMAVVAQQRGTAAEARTTWS